MFLSTLRAFQLNRSEDKMKISKTIATCFLLASTKLFAGPHNHEAHEHGVGRLNIAVEGKSIEIELELPGDTAYGFEHPAKSKSDKAAIEKAALSLQDPSQIFLLEKNASCSFERPKIEPWVEEDAGSGHGELHASFTAKCQKDISSSLLEIKLKDRFSRLHELKVQVVSNTTQGAFNLVKGTGKIKL